MGLVSGDAPEMWNFEHPDRIRDLHRSFIEAGADIILTNSFGGNRYRLKLHNAEGQVREINMAAAANARAEADSAGRPVIVAGSIGPTGEIFAPVGTLSHEDGVAAFAEQAKALAEGGVDVLWIETISSEEELQGGRRRRGDDRPADRHHHELRHQRPHHDGHHAPGLRNPTAASLPAVPAAIGANCGTGAPELIATVLAITAARPEAVVVAKGNCGIPAYHDGHIHYSGTPELMADYARLARDAGARIIGGCCGTSPEHLAAMRRALDAHVPQQRPTVAVVEQRLGEVSALAKGHDAAASAGEKRERRRRS